MQKFKLCSYWQTKQVMFYIFISSNITIALKLYTKTRGEGELKKNLQLQDRQPNQHLASFQFRRKTNFSTGKSKHREGWPFACKKVTHLNKHAETGKLSRQTPPVGKCLPTSKIYCLFTGESIYSLPRACNMPLGTQYILMRLPQAAL